MSWGNELWDQFESIASNTQKGIDFCEKYSHFVKERCAIENDYAAKLKKLVKNYSPKKKEEDQEFTCNGGFYKMVKEVHDIAGQHELISENLNVCILKELHNLMQELKQDRRKYLQEGTKYQSALQAQVQQLEKAKKQYEKAFKEAEKAKENFKKADEDIHLSRAEVEKAKTLMHSKVSVCESCKTEYASELQKTNRCQTEHYTQQMPQTFQQLQDMDERRINRTQDFIKQSADVERSVMPIINSCIDGMVKASQFVNAAEDSRLVIEKYKSGFVPPGDIPFEDLSNANNGENVNLNNTPRPARSDTLKGTTSGGRGKKRTGLLGLFSSSKTDDTKEDYSHLPPNQQRKKLNQKIDGIKQSVVKETAERDGMLKMRDVYKQNPQLGDPSTLDKQLEENAQKLDQLKQEQQKFEGYILEAENKNSGGGGDNLRAGDSLSTRVSNLSLSSSNAGSNPGTPSQSHHDISRDSQADPRPVSQRSSNAAPADNHEDSFDDLDDDEFGDMGTCVAVYAFEAPNEGSIAMAEGEQFSVLEQDQGDGWTRVKKAGGEEGFVPTSYIRVTLYDQ